MRPNNLDVPYTNHKALSQWTFGLPYTPVEEFMVQAQRQLALSHLPPGEREDLLQACSPPQHALPHTASYSILQCCSYLLTAFNPAFLSSARE